MSYYRYGRRGLDATWYLIIVNSIVFVFTFVINIINPYFYNNLFLPLVALVPGAFLSHPWTLFTSMFVHDVYSITHILFNMLALYFFGEYLSGVIGEKKFLFVYLIGGLVGGLFFILFAYTIMPQLLGAEAVGASGAIYAVGGALVALRPNTRVILFPLPVPIPLWVSILIGFLLITPGVAWQAHLGGLVAGLLMGLYFRRGERKGRYY